MNKSVDFTTTETIPSACLAVALGIGLNIITAQALFYDTAPFFYNAIIYSNIAPLILGLNLIKNIIQYKKGNVLPLYIAQALFLTSPYLIFFIGIGLISNLTAPPINHITSIAILCAIAFYIIISIKKSSKNIQETVQKNKFIEKAYKIENNRQVLKYRELNKLDSTIDKNVFPFLKKIGESKIFTTILFTIGITTIAGAYQIFPDQKMMIRFVVAGLCFLITPPIIFALVYLHHIQYKYPKMLFKEKWRITYRKAD